MVINQISVHLFNQLKKSFKLKHNKAITFQVATGFTTKKLKQWKITLENKPTKERKTLVKNYGLYKNQNTTSFCLKQCSK